MHPNIAGARMLNTPISARTLVATAPPKYPVSKTAPRIHVRGMRYSSVHANNVMPMPTSVDSGYPNCIALWTTGVGLSSFMQASKMKNAPESPVRTRPVHRRLREDLLVSAEIRIACRWVAIGCAVVICSPLPLETGVKIKIIAARQKSSPNLADIKLADRSEGKGPPH
jgi:hypothetical protein